MEKDILKSKHEQTNKHFKIFILKKETNTTLFICLFSITFFVEKNEEQFLLVKQTQNPPTAPRGNKKETKRKIISCLNFINKNHLQPHNRILKRPNIL